MARKMNFSPLLLANFIRNVNIWWVSSYKKGTFTISILQAQELHRNGLKHIIDHGTSTTNNSYDGKQQKSSLILMVMKNAYGSN
jgi:hypothetical protein